MDHIFEISYLMLGFVEFVVFLIVVYKLRIKAQRRAKNLVTISFILVIIIPFIDGLMGLPGQSYIRFLMGLCKPVGNITLFIGIIDFLKSLESR